MMMRRLAVFVIASSLTLIPVLAFAADPMSGATPGIQNPLASSFSNIPLFIAGFLKVMVQVGLPIVALFLLYSGFLFASAGGNSSKLEAAKENFKYVIIGSLLILGAWVIATIIGNTVSQIVGQSFNLN